MRSLAGLALLVCLVFSAGATATRLLRQAGTGSCQTIDAFIKSQPGVLGILGAVVEKADLSRFLDDPELEITFLAPTDDAFTSFGITKDNVNEQGEDYLTALLAYHMVDRFVAPAKPKAIKPASTTPEILTKPRLLDIAQYDQFLLSTLVKVFPVYQEPLNVNKTFIYVQFADKVDKTLKKTNFYFISQDNATRGYTVGPDSLDLPACKSNIDVINGVLYPQDLKMLVTE